MEGVHYELDSDAQFLGELEEILSPVGSTPAELTVESVINNFVTFASSFRRCTPQDMN